MYIIILIIIVLLAVLYKTAKPEHFDPNMLGYEEGLPSEYQKINYKTLETKRRDNKEFTASIWHHRFPYMVKQKYSYNDTPDGLADYSLKNVARLKELPLNLDTTLNHLPLTQDDLYYIPYSLADLRDINLSDNKFLSYDYDNMNRTTFNAGKGTSDSYYLSDIGY